MANSTASSSETAKSDTLLVYSHYFFLKKPSIFISQFIIIVYINETNSFPLQTPKPFISCSSSIIRIMNSLNLRTTPSGRHEKSANNERHETNLFGDSKTMYEEQFPPLSKSEGRSKIRKDLRAQFEKVVEKPVAASSSQLAANSTSLQDEKSQPIGYAKKNFSHANRSTRQEDKKSNPIHYKKSFIHTDSSTSQQDEKSCPTGYVEQNFICTERYTRQNEKKNFRNADSSTGQQNENYVSHANRNLKGTGKRKTRVDLGTQSEESSEKSVTDGSLQLAANLTSQQDEKYQPIVYEKNSSHANKYTSQRVENSMRRENRNPKGARGERSTDRSEKQHLIVPFDICKPNKSKSLEGENPVLERNMGIEYPVTETRQLLRPGMVLLTNYLSLREQVDIINKCRKTGLGPGGFYQPGYQDGAKLRLHMMCFGRRWDPETKYEQHIRDDPESIGIPGDFVLLVERALSDAQSLIKKNEIVDNVEEMLPGMSPDICIVNFYIAHGRLGLHQDRDESKASLRQGLPVVSFSVGDSAEFLYGDERDISKADSIILKSGDVLIFGGESRHVFHGITSVIPNTAPLALLTETNLCPGRLNLTFRQY